MNEPYGKKDWDSISASVQSLKNVWMNEPYGKKDWDVIGTSLSTIAHNLEWMSLMEKRIETNRSQGEVCHQRKGMNEPYGKKDWDPDHASFFVDVDVDWMNEPYGKKDWDPSYDSNRVTTMEEWMSLMEKRIETNHLILSHFEPPSLNEWALWKKGLRQEHLFGCAFVQTNEWALWKKGLRLIFQPWVSTVGCHQNEWALWKKGLRLEFYLCCCCCCCKTEWMSLMEKRIETRPWLTV